MALIAAHLNAEVILVVTVLPLPPPPYPLPPFSTSPISCTVSVDVKHHICLLTTARQTIQLREPITPAPTHPTSVFTASGLCASHPTD